MNETWIADETFWGSFIFAFINMRRRWRLKRKVESDVSKQMVMFAVLWRNKNIFKNIMDIT